MTAADLRACVYDVEYLGGALVVELDGRLGHDGTEDRWADLNRDIDSVIAGATTVRLAWGQVLDACRLAAAIGRLLRAVGTDRPRAVRRGRRSTSG